MVKARELSSGIVSIPAANGVVIGCIIGGGICEAIGSTNGVVIGGPIGPGIPGGPIDAIGFGVVIGGAICERKRAKRVQKETSRKKHCTYLEIEYSGGEEEGVAG